MWIENLCKFLGDADAVVTDLETRLLKLLPQSISLSHILNGYLGCFQLLRITNGMNIYVIAWFICGYISFGVGFLVYRICIYSTLVHNAKQFFKVLYLFIFPSSVCESTHCSISLSTLNIISPLKLIVLWVYHVSHSVFFFLEFYFTFIYLFIYLFISGCVGSLLLRAGFLQLRRAGATLCCGVRASHCGGFSCCRAWALGTRASVVVAHGLQSTGSVVVVHGLSCFTACGIFPDPGLNPCPLRWQADS